MISQFGYPQQGSISVAFVNNGKQGAQQFTVGAGNTVIIFDTDHKQFFIKEVRQNGFPQPLRAYNYEELVQHDDNEFVTRKEFEELKDLITNRLSPTEVKQDESWVEQSGTFLRARFLRTGWFVF